MTTPLTDNDLLALGALDDEASNAGSWIAGCVGNTVRAFVAEAGLTEWRKDVELVLHSRDAIPRLLAEVLYWRDLHGAPPTELPEIEPKVQAWRQAFDAGELEEEPPEPTPEPEAAEPVAVESNPLAEMPDAASDG